MKALWELPEFRRDYVARLRELESKVWRVEVLTNRLANLTDKLVQAAPDRATTLQVEEESRKLRLTEGPY